MKVKYIFLLHWVFVIIPWSAATTEFVAINCLAIFVCKLNRTSITVAFKTFFMKLDLFLIFVFFSQSIWMSNKRVHNSLTFYFFKIEKIKKKKIKS